MGDKKFVDDAAALLGFIGVVFVTTAAMQLRATHRQIDHHNRKRTNAGDE